MTASDNAKMLERYVKVIELLGLQVLTWRESPEGEELTAIKAKCREHESLLRFFETDALLANLVERNEDWTRDLMGAEFFDLSDDDVREEAIERGFAMVDEADLRSIMTACPGLMRLVARLAFAGNLVEVVHLQRELRQELTREGVTNPQQVELIARGV